MNPVGQPLQQRPLTTKLILAGILGLIVFVMFQVAPSSSKAPVRTQQLSAKAKYRTKPPHSQHSSSATKQE